MLGRGEKCEITHLKCCKQLSLLRTDTALSVLPFPRTAGIAAGCASFLKCVKETKHNKGFKMTELGVEIWMHLSPQPN